MEKMSYAILGPGAVGGFIASRLSATGNPVTCIAKSPSYEKMSKDGLAVESIVFGNYTAKPRVVQKLDFQPDVLFVTTKATTLMSALELAEPSYVRNATVIPLLNGVEHMQILRKQYDNVVAGNISIETYRKDCTHIVHSSTFNVMRLATDTKPKETLENIAQDIVASGIKCEILNTEAEVVWGKLVRLNAIACTTAASGESLGYVRTNPAWREKLIGCIAEGAKIATAEGLPTKPEKVLEMLDGMDPALKSSMQRDIKNGITPELDAIPGAIIRTGRKNNICCPVIEDLVETIKYQIREGYGKQN